MNTGRRIEIRGTVQGVGFRPWVYRVAREIGVTGRVRNHPQGVTVEAFGRAAELDALVERLRVGAPPPACVRDLSAIDIPGEAVDDFVIEASGTSGERALSIPPDLATCDQCAAEIADPNDRRHGYAFTNCTACGPRFTIATGVPYDRGATTMAPFVMCPACKREYGDVGDRRFHAQPNACPVCGPKLSLRAPDGSPLLAPDPLSTAATGLTSGAIVAIKGLGGFHLACDAGDAAAVARLRERKRRDHKPFAVMVRDLHEARRIARIDHVEAQLLRAPERPIVLVPRRADALPGIAREVAPDTELLGLMLPYTPLHHLLLAAVDRPLVMTSANLSEEPICVDEIEASTRLVRIADLLLVHDREIATRCDDSVARVIGGKPTLLRRSRGYVPRSVALARPLARPVLACGAHLKNTFCIAARDTAYLGPHIGDLESLAALGFFEQAIERMERLLQITPIVIAHDLHPGYLSTRYASARPALRHVGVQHHHAHIASAMAEHGLAGPVIGVAYDGTGWGDDGTSWGGEIMLTRFEGYQRLATFRPIALPGGDTAIRAPWRIALALLEDAYGVAPLDLPLFGSIADSEVALVRQMIETGLNTPLARGVGRYFDGIAALALARPRAHYDGELATSWNQLADEGERRPYPWRIDHETSVTEIDLRPMVRAVVADVRARVPVSTIAARFHETIIAATEQVVRAALEDTGPLPVVLTGGCFQNPRLALGVSGALDGVDVRRHGEVPPGDGGIALGQALVADARTRGDN